jgi:CBS domain-containing protein
VAKADDRTARVTTVGDIMTRDVFVTDPTASVADVASNMLRRRIGSALVMQGSTLLGIVTERDVLRAAAAGSDPSSSRVSEWMTVDPVTTDADMDADEAIETMMSNGFRHLPVVTGGRLAGVVSLRDIVRTQIGRRR